MKTIRTQSINKASYVTIATGYEAEVIWQGKWNYFYFPKEKNVEEEFNRFENAVKGRKRLDVDLVAFMEIIKYYKAEIRETKLKVNKEDQDNKSSK